MIRSCCGGFRRYRCSIDASRHRSICAVFEWQQQQQLQQRQNYSVTKLSFRNVFSCRHPHGTTETATNVAQRIRTIFNNGLRTNHTFHSYCRNRYHRPTHRCFHQLVLRKNNYTRGSNFDHRSFLSSSNSNSTKDDGTNGADTKNTSNINRLLRPPTIDDVRELHRILCYRPGCIDIDYDRLNLNSNDNDNNEMKIYNKDKNISKDDRNDRNDSINQRRRPILEGIGQLEEYYNVDWTKHYKSSCTVLVRPSNTNEVSQILNYCSNEKIGIVPVGGRTGLVGGTVGYTSHEILLSLERLNTIIEMADSDNIASTGSNNKSYNTIIKCQAGCILQNVQNYCSDRNLLLPIDLGSKGSCQMGGVVSTNAGGSYYTRYGSIGSNIIGLEVCLANQNNSNTDVCTVLDLNYNKSIVYKDNSNLYKLQQLFIGSEGTIGIITGIVMNCYMKPLSKQGIFLKIGSFQDVLTVVHTACTILGETLAACEWMDSNVIRSIFDNYNDSKGKNITAIPFAIPISDSNDTNDKELFDSSHTNYLLIETHGCNCDHDRSKMDLFLDTILDDTKNDTPRSSSMIDGVIAQDIKQLDEFWKIRESANPVIGSLGYSYKYDLSFPNSSYFDEFIHTIRSKIKNDLSSSNNTATSTTTNTTNNMDIRVYNWGHILDGNLHLNIVSVGVYEIDEAIVACIEPYIFDQVIIRGGSISAEHGLGQAKNKLLSISHNDNYYNIHSAKKIAIMKSIKSLFDPNQILNPGKFLPP